MKLIIFVLCIIVQSLSYAADYNYLSADAEAKALDKIFTKARYILNAALNAHILKLIEPEKYENILAFVGITEKLVSDANVLQEEANKLGKGALYLVIAINQVIICASSLGDDSQCLQSLTSLKDFLWNRKFGKEWSDYPPLTIWTGFPEGM